MADLGIDPLRRSHATRLFGSLLPLKLGHLTSPFALRADDEVPTIITWFLLFSFQPQRKPRFFQVALNPSSTTIGATLYRDEPDAFTLSLAHSRRVRVGNSKCCVPVNVDVLFAQIITSFGKIPSPSSLAPSEIRFGLTPATNPRCLSGCIACPQPFFSSGGIWRTEPPSFRLSLRLQARCAG